MPASSQRMRPLTQVEGSCLEEPPPPPIPPPPKTWHCVECSRVETPVKRSGPKGPATLCNACGIAFRKKLKLAAAKPAATHKPPQKKPIQKNRPPPKKKAIKRKSDHAPPPHKVPRRQPAQLQSVQSTAVPPPVAIASQPLSSSVTTIPSQLVRAPSPVTPIIPTSAVAPLTCAPQTAILPSPTHVIPCPPPSASFAAPSMLPPFSIGLTTPTSALPTATAIQYSAPVPSTVRMQRPHPDKPIVPEVERLLQSEPTLEPMMTLLRQSSQTEESNAEGVLPPTDVAPVDINTCSPEFAYRPHATGFPDGMFAPTDSTATTSTPGEVLSMLDGVTGYSETWPPGTSMVSVEGPYGEEGSMAAPTGLLDMPGVSMPVSTGLTLAANPMSETGFPPASVPPNVVQLDNVTRCINTLTTLDLTNAQICQRMSSIDDQIEAYAKRHQELTLERNEANFQISELIQLKDVAKKKQHLVCEFIARTKSFLQNLRKQERQIGST